jgi:hypothetical protein
MKALFENPLSIEHLKLRISSIDIAIKILPILLLFLTGCVSYSFTGGDTGSAKTITIRNFNNDAGGGPASLTQNFSEKLREYYQQNTKLTLVRSGGDWELDGRIVGWTLTPMAPTEGGTAGLTRLTIRIVVNFTNRMEGPKEIKGYENREFSGYDDFKQGQSLSDVEQELINNISNRIILDIFSSTTSNW